MDTLQRSKSFHERSTPLQVGEARFYQATSMMKEYASTKSQMWPPPPTGEVLTAPQKTAGPTKSLQPVCNLVGRLASPFETANYERTRRCSVCGLQPLARCFETSRAVSSNCKDGAFRHGGHLTRKFPDREMPVPTER